METKNQKQQSSGAMSESSALSDVDSVYTPNTSNDDSSSYSNGAKDHHNRDITKSESEYESEHGAEPPKKKARREWGPRPKGMLAELQYYAQWYQTLDDPDADITLKGRESRRNFRRRKTFSDEQAEEAERQRQLTMKRREQRLAKEAKEAENRRLEEARRQEEENIARMEERKRKAEERAKKGNVRKPKKSAESEDSSSSTPDPNNPDILRNRNTEGTKVEVHYPDGYIPFVKQLHKDEQIPIRDNFFVKEVYESTVGQIKELAFTSAHNLMESINYKHYRTLKDVEPVIFKFQSTVYPAIQEDYYLMESSRDFHLDSFEEMGKTMELLALNYFPDEHKLQVFNPEDPYSSIVGRYAKAYYAEDNIAALGEIEKFNTLVNSIHESGGFVHHLKNKKTISRLFIHELLNQFYSRSVSPNVSKLKSYKAFSNNVYGELMPKFLSKVFDQCGLNANSCFIDLGSGVGNVSIQAALEYGCESYGVEIMENCSELAALQLDQLQTRSKLFGIQPGYCELFHKQSFVNNPRVKEIIDRCDVILCNNFLFTPELNEECVKLFGNLKKGTKIISLKNIIPDSHHADFDDMENYLNKFEVRKYEFGNNSVSWTHRGGIFYITEYTDLISMRALTVFNTRSRERERIKETRESWAL